MLSPTVQAYSAADSKIIEAIIAESIASYPSNCACPYSLARNGSRCGKRSAYSRAGGYSVKCYKEDVSPSEIESRRKLKSSTLNQNREIRDNAKSQLSSASV